MSSRAEFDITSSRPGTRCSSCERTRDARRRAGRCEIEKKSLQNSQKHESAHFIIHLDEKQDGILADYLKDNLERTYRVMAERYGFRPEEKIRVEFFPDTKAFYLCSTLSARDIEVAGAVGLAQFNRCGGIVKTATISFGQAMPVEAMRRAEQATLSCDLFLAVGSSLVVYPAAGFPELAKRNGARLVILNRDPTPLDPLVDLVLNAEIGPILSAAVSNESDGISD